MSAHDNGGPAFPVLDSSYGNLGLRDPGMTLRDWFAGQALSGMASIESIGAIATEAGMQAPRFMAAYSYLIADAMLAARKGDAS